jgi:hypothetical protein
MRLTRDAAKPRGFNAIVSVHGFRDSALDTAAYRKDCAAKLNEIKR